MANKKKLSSTTMRMDIPLDIDEKPAKKKIITIRNAKTPGLAGDEDVIKVHKGKPDDTRFNALLNAVYDAVLLTDQKGSIVQSNIRASKLFGYETEDLRTMSILSLISGASKQLIETIDGNLIDERFTLIDAYCNCKDGRTFPVEIAVNRIYLTKVGELCFFVRDITQRKEMEKNLRHANKITSLHMLAGGVAHDYNNLLTSVIGNTELALAGLPPSSKIREDLTIALEDAKKMALLSNRMMAFSGKGLLQKTRVNINDILKVLSDKASSIIPNNIELTITQSRAALYVGGEKDVLEGMMENIIINSVEAIGRTSGQIKVNVSLQALDADYLEYHSLDNDIMPGKYVALMVADSGYGMDSVIVEKVFDPFFSTKGAGRGLGLSEVQGIVIAHGGAITIETEIGSGCLFSVFLPLHEGEMEPVSDLPAHPEIDVSGKMVLVVDDEPSVRRYADRILRRQGFVTLLARDGEEAVDQFREHADEIDVVLLDMFMPKMNGDEALLEIRKIRPGVKVLISSGYSDTVYNERFGDEQPTGFLFKPFATADFMEKVMEALQL